MLHVPCFLFSLNHDTGFCQKLKKKKKKFFINRPNCCRPQRSLTMRPLIVSATIRYLHLQTYNIAIKAFLVNPHLPQQF